MVSWVRFSKLKVYSFCFDRQFSSKNTFIAPSDQCCISALNSALGVKVVSIDRLTSFLCCFSSNGVYSEWTSPFCLRHHFVLYLAKRFHIYGLTHLRSREAELIFAEPLDSRKISTPKSGTFLQSAKRNYDVSLKGRFIPNMSCFLLKFAAKFLLFKVFCNKNAENDYLDQRLACAAPKRWSKYTTQLLLVSQKLAVD